jgi:hypothetical protein
VVRESTVDNRTPASGSISDPKSFAWTNLPINPMK